MTATASLGMYDHPSQRAANDRLWAAMAQFLRAQGVAEVPDRLDRSRSVYETWHDPDLLFGQICGYPLISDATLALRVLALPVYAAPGCEGDTHSSFVIARRGEAGDLAGYRGRRAAINDRGSNSGMNLFRATFADIAGGGPFFASVAETGSHRDSVRAVVEDRADIAAIDAVTFAALVRFEPGLIDALEIVAGTPRSPNLPFVTSQSTSVATVALLHAGLALLIADPGLADARADLFLGGIAPAGIDRFEPLRALERGAVLAGYPELR